MNGGIKFKGNLRRYLSWPVYLTILLILADAAMFNFDIKSGCVLSVFTLIYFIVVLTLYFHNKPLLANELINYSTRYALVQRSLLNEFELPYALLDCAGKLLWVNSQFSEITGVNKKYHKSVTTIFPTITREFLQKNADPQDVMFDLGEKRFRISLTRIYLDSMMDDGGLVEFEDGDEFLTALYLFDETELTYYKQENLDQKLVAALVYIDNYDEVFDSIEEVKRSVLLALIDRRVNRYFSQFDALVRKMEKDKYFIVFKHKYLEKLKEDRFSLIDEVKVIKAGNDISITLSIGVGMRGDSYNQNYEFARAAIDLALGRGGDQVVLKEGTEVFYYGGNAKQVERNTRVKARVKAQALREIMAGRDNVIIMGHQLTDVDALGAGIGIYCAAHALGKRAQIVINNPTTSVRPLMDLFDSEHGYPEDLFINSELALDIVGRNSLVMVVDTNRPSYTECPGLLRRTEYIVVFDHHRQGSEAIEKPLLSYVEPYASSACEMVAEVLQYFQEGLRLEPQEADCIYAGMLIDTNNFMNKTGVRTFEAAAYLKRCGAEVTRVRKLLRDDFNSTRARGEAIRQSEIYRGRFALSVCPPDGLKSPTVVCAQAANELLNVIGVQASFVLTDYNNKIYISARSIDEVNVQLVMERLGGGGHLSVAGAQLTDCDLQGAMRRVRDTLDDMIAEGDIK